MLLRLAFKVFTVHIAGLNATRWK